MKVFEDYGCTIISRDGKFFICYDTGESAGSIFAEHEISLDEVEKVKRSEVDAYNVILCIQNRNEKNKI